MRALFTIGIGLMLTSACASGRLTGQQESSSASIRAAEEVGAQDVPRAALHLQLAKEQFQAAESEHSDHERASRLLARAQADAELALALARTEQERADARMAIEKLNGTRVAQ